MTVSLQQFRSGKAAVGKTVSNLLAYSAIDPRGDSQRRRDAGVNGLAVWCIPIGKRWCVGERNKRHAKKVSRDFEDRRIKNRHKVLYVFAKCRGIPTAQHIHVDGCQSAPVATSDS